MEPKGKKYRSYIGYYKSTRIHEYKQTRLSYVQPGDLVKFDYYVKTAHTMHPHVLVLHRGFMGRLHCLVFDYFPPIEFDRIAKHLKRLSGDVSPDRGATLTESVFMLSKGREYSFYHNKLKPLLEGNEKIKIAYRTYNTRYVKNIQKIVFDYRIKHLK